MGGSKGTIVATVLYIIIKKCIALLLCITALGESLMTNVALSLGYICHLTIISCIQTGSSACNNLVMYSC